MNSADPREQDDAKDMDAISSAYRAAREADGDNMLPPPALDDAIRAAARRAVQSGPRAAGAGGFGKWTRKWTPQLSAAAVIVLSVSVIFVSVQERPDVASLSATFSADSPQEKKLITPSRDSNPVMAAKILQESAAPMVVLPPEKESGNRRDAGSADAYNIVLPAPKISAQAATDREQRGRIAAAAEAKVALPEVVANTPIPAPVPAAPMAVAPPVYAPPAAAAPPPVPFVPSPSQPGSVLPYRGGAVDHKFVRAVPPAEPAAEPPQLQKKEAAPAASDALAAGAPIREKTIADQVRRTESAPVAAAAAAPAPPPGQAAAQIVTPAASTVRAAPAVASRAAAAQTDVAKPKDATTSASAGSSASGALQNYADKAVASASAPEASAPWLKRMLELREHGKLKELREELVRFKKTYPDFVLPKSLIDLPAE